MNAEAIARGTVLLGPFYTRHEAARRANLPAPELAVRLGLIRLAGRFSVEEAYLAFQFDADGIRSDIAEAVERLTRRLDPCRTADWLVRPHPDLAGKAPLEWLRSGGRLETVLDLISKLDAEARPS